ncbi:histone deacetylase RPD3 [Panus rudis PR-1116 ss-1]|nr:histone deacetylase RPD3 [Panus rudis PR-1116 ss-1]
MSKRRVAYYYDPDVGAYTYGLGHPMKPQRMRITHEIVSSYGMLEHMTVLRAKRATAEEMTRFHTDEYVEFLVDMTPDAVENQLNQMRKDSHSQQFPGTYHDDNPPWDGLFEFCSLSAGGSIAAAQRLATGASDIAINWAGGLHHAKKREASGFCYVNDIVLGILELLRVFPRVLYIDIDCHHGDGVEEAFYTTSRVMTCSFHKFGEYFPGTGAQEDRGTGEGKGYALNVPFKDGLTDESLKSVFEPVISKVIEVYQPSAIVLQCGADSLAGDKLGCFNVTMQGHAHCVEFVRNFNIPFMLLGGGGYTVKNVARTWAYETACALGIQDTIDPNLPWNEYFEWFGPRYRLEVLPNNMEDLNVKEKTLDKVREVALQQLSEIRPAPSVGLQDVPRESLGKQLGLSHTEVGKVDKLDEQLAQHTRFVYGLQESESDPESESEPESDDSAYSRGRTINKTSRKRKRQQRVAKARMSIITNQYVEPPAVDDEFYDYGLGWAVPSADGPGRVKRRFFDSGAKWDASSGRVVSANGISSGSRFSVTELMERGGRFRSEEGSDEERMDVEDED